MVPNLNTAELDPMQCDLIGQFLKSIWDKFYFKSSPNIV